MANEEDGEHLGRISYILFTNFAIIYVMYWVAKHAG